MESFEQAREIVDRLVAAWRAPVAVADILDTEQAFGNPDLNALFEAASALDDEGRGRVLGLVAEGIAGLEPTQASRLALVAGTMVESGFDPEGALDAILDGLAGAAARAHDGLVRAFYEIEDTGSLGQTYAVIELLRASDGETVIVVCPATRRGARFTTTAVRNCAHLYTLLDLVLRENGVNLLGGRWAGLFAPRLDADARRMLEAARGDAEAYAALDDDAMFVGRHAFRPWTEIEEDGSFLGIPMVGIDAPVVGLGQLDGTIVLGAGDYRTHGPRRTWDVAFFEPLHEDLRSDVAFEGGLTGGETDAWLARMR